MISVLFFYLLRFSIKLAFRAKMINLPRIGSLFSRPQVFGQLLACDPPFSGRPNAIGRFDFDYSNAVLIRHVFASVTLAVQLNG